MACIGHGSRFQVHSSAVGDLSMKPINREPPNREPLNHAYICRVPRISNRNQ